MTRSSLLVAVAALSSPAVALAANVDVTICAEYRTDHLDLTDGYTYETDYFKTNADKPAWGAKLRIQNAITEAVVANVFTDWQGPDAGCATVSLDEFTYYRVEIRADAEVNGNRIKVRKDDTNHALWTTPWSSSFQPAALSGDLVVKTGLHKAWNVAAAAGWAMKRRNAGLSNETFNAYTCGCPKDTYACDDTKPSGHPWRGRDCWHPGTESVYILKHNSIFITTHELGHGVADFVNNHDGVDMDYHADEDGCDAGTLHFWNSKEYNSAALSEGYATYYSAVAFNKTDELSCTLWGRYRIDWNYSNTYSTEEQEPFSCYGAPIPNEPLMDYYGEYCEGTGLEEDNRGTEYDWVRFLWELDQDYGFSTAQLFQVLVEADADDWNEDSNGTGANAPTSRMRGAPGTPWSPPKGAYAVDHGLGVVWNARESAHGVHR